MFVSIVKQVAADSEGRAQHGYCYNKNKLKIYVNRIQTNARKQWRNMSKRDKAKHGSIQNFALHLFKRDRPGYTAYRTSFPEMDGVESALKAWRCTLK